MCTIGAQTMTNAIVGVPYYDNIPQNPILIFKAPTLQFLFSRFRNQGTGDHHVGYSWISTASGSRCFSSLTAVSWDLRFLGWQ